MKTLEAVAIVISAVLFALAVLYPPQHPRLVAAGLFFLSLTGALLVFAK